MSPVISLLHQLSGARAFCRGITGDTIAIMSEISIRELRNHGGDVVDRAAKGERLTITRSGKAVAELRPLGREPVPLNVVISRRRRLPAVDPGQLREDLDKTLDPAL